MSNFNQRDKAQNQSAVLAFEKRVPVIAHRFVTAESFTRGNPRVTFSYINERFLKIFGRISENVPASELVVHTLIYDAHDPDVMAAIQPHFLRFIRLGQFYQLIEDQGQGQEGPLLVDGMDNIGYVIGENGGAWAVSARWSQFSIGWRVFDHSVACPNEWSARCQVLSQAA